jgi:hypothetical protein
MPTGFWKNYKGDLIKEDISDQGPWGGHRTMLWESKVRNQFETKEIIDFATNNGWTFVEEIRFDSGDIALWTYNRSMIFPLSHEGFDAKVKVNNGTYAYFPRWIAGNIELLKFRTEWVTVRPGSGKSNVAYGYVIINKNKTKMSIYHLWGE